jgi:hypothetical protein
MRTVVQLIATTLMLAGCGSGTVVESLFSFTAPPEFDGPVTVPIGPDSAVHHFMRMRGDHVARIDVAPVYISSEYPDYYGSLELDSAACANSALTGHARDDVIIAREEPKKVSVGSVPGTVIYYTKERKGTTYAALMACVRHPKVAITIAFQEPSGVKPSDMAAVLHAIQSVSFE